MSVLAIPNPFLNLGPAALAAAIAIPTLLVLYFLKLRRREMPVSSTLLWKKAIQDLQVNAPFQRLRRNLLLLLQLLLLALLVLAFARPVVNRTQGAGQTTVIIIDRSASMSAKDGEDGRTRLEEAKRRAIELVNTMKRDASAMVIAFDDKAETVIPFTTDTLALRNAIQSIKPTDRKSRLAEAYQLAEAQLSFIPEMNRTNVTPPEVRLYSDGRVLDANELDIQSPVTFERIGSDASGNIGIVALSAKRNYERPTQVQVFARLANFGPQPVEAFVELSVDGETVEVGGNRLHKVFLLPERWDEGRRKTYVDDNDRQARDSVEFALDLTNAAVIRLEQMKKDGDALAADDVAQVVVPPPKQLSVLLVTDGNYFLEKAVQSLRLKKPDQTTPTAYEDKVPQGYDVVIFDRYKPKKLPTVGSMFYFGAVPDGLKLKVAKDPKTGNNLPPLLDIGVLDWRRDHPIFRGLGMSKLYVATAPLLEVPLESEVLLDGLKGPLVVLHREGKHTHLVVAFDVLQSNWPLRKSFPYFMHNAMQYLAVGTEMDVRQSFEPGASPRIPRSNLVRGGSVMKEVTLEGPAWKRDLAVPEQGDFVLPPLDRVGIYTTSPAVPKFEKLAVNLLDANESNLMPAPGEGLLGDTRTIEGTASKARRELWLVIAAIALVLLFVEWWVYTRRVHM